MKEQRVSTQEIFYYLMKILCQNAGLYYQLEKELKYSRIVLLESIETDRGYHLVSYRRFVALSQQQQETMGEPLESGSQNKTELTRSGITMPKSHSNAGMFPKNLFIL